jgi:two-component system chemotaxis response regulator CheB
VLVVQHMAVGFTTGLTAWLGRQTELPVRVARAGDRATGPGIWFAPDEAHLVVDRRLGLGLDRRTGGRHVPSADVLFTSMARALGADAATVVLTGLGADGAAGTAAVVAAGGLTFAQDAASSVVDGMPKSARDAGAEIVVALGDVAPSLAALVPKAGP